MLKSSKKARRKRLLGLVSFCFVLAVSLTGTKACADPDDLSETAERAIKVKVSLNDCLSPESYQLASELGMLPHLARLQRLNEHEKHLAGAPLSQENVTTRKEIVELVMITVLQCQAVIAEIDSETAGVLAIRQLMQDRVNKAVNTTSAADLVANGALSSVGNLLGLPFETVTDARYEFPGEIIASGANIMATGFGGAALYQSNGPKLSAPIEPNMLAKVFKRPNDSKTEYPNVIWQYLNSRPPGAKPGELTRRELLIARWVSTGRLQPLNQPKGQTYARIVAGTVPQKQAVTIDMLEDREAMLGDLRAEVNQIYEELLNIMLVVRAL